MADIEEYIPDLLDVELSSPKFKQITHNSVIVWGTTGRLANVTVFLLDADDKELTSKKIEETDGFFEVSFIGLPAQTNYKVYFKATDTIYPDIYGEDISITESFTTAKQIDDTRNITNILLSPIDSLTGPTFRLTFNFNPDWSAWETNITGYTLSFYVNGVLKKTIIEYNTDKKKKSFDLNLDYLQLNINYNDSIQVGIRAFVKSGNNYTYNSDFLAYSNSICLKQNFYVFNRIYLKTNSGIRKVNLFGNKLIY